jgi:hypothetical protein
MTQVQILAGFVECERGGTQAEAVATTMTASTTAVMGWLRRTVPAAERERWAALWSFAYFFTLLAGYYVLRPLRDQMGIASGVKNLPWLFTATFVSLLVAQPLYGALTSRGAGMRTTGWCIAGPSWKRRPSRLPFNRGCRNVSSNCIPPRQGSSTARSTDAVVCIQMSRLTFSGTASGPAG